MEQLSANTLQKRKKYISKSPPLARRSSITISKPLPPLWLPLGMGLVQNNTDINSERHSSQLMRPGGAQKYQAAAGPSSFALLAANSFLEDVL